MAGPSAHEKTIKAILRASNHFDVLQLPKPYPDLMDEPTWDVDPERVNKAFRKLSLSCHPDKSSHPDAPRAFETLKRSKAILTHELDRDDYLRAFLKGQKTAWEGSWSAKEAACETKDRVASMRGQAQEDLSDQVADAMAQRREKAQHVAQLAAMKKRRLEAAAASSQARRRQEESKLDSVSSDDDEPAAYVPKAARGSAPGGPKKRPRGFI